MRRFCFALALLANGAMAAERLPGPDHPESRGRVIAERAEAQDTGFGSSVTELRMVLENAEGRVRTRHLTWKILEHAAGDRSLVVFHEPRDIAGTALLSHSRPGGDDDQWLYLPALKRVKRIAAGNRSSAFVGSEFSYEDLMPERVEDYAYRWLRDEACGDWRCHVVERRPGYADSAYSKQRLWLDTQALRLVRAEYYDDRERLLKVLTAEDFRRYRDRYWRAHAVLMTNRITGKLTRLTFEPYDFAAELHEREFAPGALRRLR